MFIGKSGLKKGWNTTLSNYKKSYLNKEEMGTLKFKNIDYKNIDNESFLVTEIVFSKNLLIHLKTYPCFCLCILAPSY